jgi:hypothetical protein
MTDNEPLLDLLRSSDPGDARYTPQSLLRVAKRRRQRMRIGASAASCLAVATAAVLVVQIAPSGHSDRDVVTTTSPPTPTRVEAFGAPRLPLCFARADTNSRLPIGAATPAPGNHTPIGIFPNVATAKDAIDYCAHFWSGNSVAADGNLNPRRPDEANGGSQVPPLFACAYRLIPRAAAGFRGDPPSTHEVAVFPALANQPDTCADLDLNTLSR